MEEKKEMKKRKKEFKRARRKAARPWKFLTWFSLPFAVVLMAATIVTSIFDNSFSIFVGGTFNHLEHRDDDAVYFESDFDSKEEMVHYEIGRAHV